MTQKSPPKSFIPYVLLLLFAVGFISVMIWAPSPESLFLKIQQNRLALNEWVDANFIFASTLYIASYIIVVALSLPFGLVLTVTGGFIFGLVTGTILTVLGATLGASLLFWLARTTFGVILEKKAGKWTKTVQKGFEKGEVSYLFLIRLVPIIPFFIANIVPALLKTRFKLYVLTTFLGIIPGSLVYSSIGHQLQVTAASLPTENAKILTLAEISGAIFQPSNLVPILGLALLSLLPLFLKTFNLWQMGAQNGQSH